MLNIWLNFAITLSPRVGNGNPFQYSCLENSMDRETLWATVHGLQRVRHDWAHIHTHIHTHTHITQSAINRNILQVCALQIYLSCFSISSTMYSKTTRIKGAKKVIVKDIKRVSFHGIWGLYIMHAIWNTWNHIFIEIL